MKRYGKISKAGSRLLRFFLGEAVRKAIRTDTELRSFYYRLLNKRETSRAIVSVARKLLVRSFIMLRDGIDYNEFKAAVSKHGLPELFRGSLMPDHLIGRPASPDKGECE